MPDLAYLPQLPGMLLTGFGLGLITSPTNTDALGRVSAEHLNQASDLVQTTRQLGGTVGVAVLGALVLGIEHHGTHADSPRHAAPAIALGIGCSALALAVALMVAWRLLPAGPLATRSAAAHQGTSANPLSCTTSS